MPVADGGEGTAETLTSALDGRMMSKRVCGPDGVEVEANFGLSAQAGIAVVELAQASGLALLAAGRNDPMTATTFGTGQLIAEALDAGARRIIVAIGGSATTDAGTGALSALGARFLDDSGRPLPPGGGSLRALADIDVTRLEERLHGIAIEVASDVTNPLCGPRGAAAVYGPQKDASPHQVQLLDDALRRFADVAARKTGADVRDVPGAGAAGGMGAGFLSLAHATLRPGAQLVLEVLDFDRHLEGVTLVVTGEGRLDRQTFCGKAPHAVAQAASAAGIPVVALAGSVDCPPTELAQHGIGTAISLVPGPLSLEEATAQAGQLLSDAAERLARALAMRLEDVD